jgi:hypothetical protein
MTDNKVKFPKWKAELLERFRLPFMEEITKQIYERGAANVHPAFTGLHEAILEFNNSIELVEHDLSPEPEPETEKVYKPDE